MRNAALSAALAVLASVSSWLKADTYSISLLLPGDSDFSLYGLTADDTVVLKQAFYPSDRYLVYPFGQPVAVVPASPRLAYDNGSACGSGLCNGRFGAFVDASGQGLLAADGASRSRIFVGAEVLLGGINQYGDIAFEDQSVLLDDFYLARDLTSRVAPEPSTFALLGTGLLGLIGAARRRLVAS